jgi:arabinogalactan endo-1,4-beta-galactosidase
MKKAICVGSILLFMLNFSCSKSNNNKPAPQPTTTAYKPPVVSASFTKGADISWITQMEASGYKFYNQTGQQEDLFVLMKSLGVTAIRLRVWVNPTNGWCNTADVVAKAVRAKNAGLKVMIDFHYSDTWADPGDQNKPAAWANLAFADLTTTMYNYTVGVMDTLKANGITPAWVQVGNETSNGMLWNDGMASTNMAQFAALVTSGYNAVKSVSSTTQVIVHLANGYDNATYTWLFNGLKSNGAKWDIIGMSLYPTISNYTALDTQCLANINAMIARYGTPVMLCEVGMEADQPADTRAFLTDIITKVNSVANSQGLGVFYWEPEAFNWQNYGLGAFDDTGKPTIALDAFGN